MTAWKALGSLEIHNPPAQRRAEELGKQMRTELANCFLSCFMKYFSKCLHIALLRAGGRKTAIKVLSSDLLRPLSCSILHKKSAHVLTVEGAPGQEAVTVNQCETARSCPGRESRRARCRLPVLGEPHGARCPWWSRADGDTAAHLGSEDTSKPPLLLGSWNHVWGGCSLGRLLGQTRCIRRAGLPSHWATPKCQAASSNPTELGGAEVRPCSGGRWCGEVVVATGWPCLCPGSVLPADQPEPVQHPTLQVRAAGSLSHPGDSLLVAAARPRPTLPCTCGGSRACPHVMSPFYGVSGER